MRHVVGGAQGGGRGAALDGPHDGFAAGERRHRHAAADALGEAHHVRLHAEPLGPAAVGDDAPVFTSSKIRTIPWAVASSRTRSRKPGSGGTTPMLYWIGSTMMAAISPSVALEDGLQRLGIVERGDDRVRQPGARDAGRGRNRVRGVHRAHQGGRGHDADQDVVVVAVVPALELHDLVASGEAAGDPDGVHRDLGPRVAEADEVHPEAAADLLGGDRGLLRGEGEDRAPARPARGPLPRPPDGCGRRRGPRRPCRSRCTRCRRRPRSASPAPRA